MKKFKARLRNIAFNRKYSSGQILAFIKENGNANEYEDAINTNPLLKKEKLRNNIFLSKEKITHRQNYPFTNDLKKELMWIFYNIKSNSKSIDQFIVEKYCFEKDFICGDYKSAANKLQEIKSKFGINLWTIEQDLLLKEFQIDTKENWIELSTYLSELKSPFYKFLINFYSQRIEAKMSFENCFNQFQNDFAEVNAEDRVRDFLVFKSLYVANYDYVYSKLEGVLHLANIFSDIDQYLILSEALIKLASYDQDDKVLLPFIKKLHKQIPSDYRLSNIGNIHEIESLKISPASEEVVMVLDEFYLGNYEKSILISKELIPKYPLNFELYEIYCKSLINCQKQFTKLDKSSLVDSLLETTYKTLLLNNEHESNQKKILKLSLTLLSFDFGKQLFYFASSFTKIPNRDHHKIISVISSSISSPEIFSIPSKDYSKSALAKSDFCALHDSFEINLFQNGSDVPLTDLVKNNLCKDVYSARRNFNNKEYKSVVKLLGEYLEEVIPAYILEEVIFLISESYLRLEMLAEAINLFSKIIISETLYVYRIDINKLTQLIRNRGFEEYRDLIDTPILFSSNSQDFDLYEPYDEFMVSQCEDYPSRLNIDALFEEFGRDRVIYFLKNVCVTSTLQYSLEFDSLDIAEQERQSICILLKQIDPDNYKEYDNEISNILRKTAVRKVIKEVDEGRLYVNIESLKNLQNSNIKESFTRFKEIEGNGNSIGLIGFNSSKDKNWLDSIDNPGRNKVYDDLAFLAFKSIYIETREKFLFSKEYGLESCLSGRIRHGTMKNILRSVFDKLNLVTAKSGDKYLDNPHWDLLFEKSTNEKVQQRLKIFSKEIDDYTIHIVEDLMQIQTEKSDESKRQGLFNYRTNDKGMMYFFINGREYFEDYDSLISSIYNELAAVTAFHVVPFIQKTIQEKFNLQFQNLIESLQIDIKNIIGENNQTELLAKIYKSSTDIRDVLDNIKDWFQFKTTESSSLLEVETLLNASTELTNKFNANCTISPQINLIYPDDLSVVSSSTMIYVFQILLDNIVKHSGLDSKDLSVVIDVIKINNYIEIKFTNNLDKRVNVKQVKNKLNEIKKKWNDHSRIERSNIEGGSGFDKIKRILLFEAKAKTEKFEYFVDRSKVSVSLFLPLNIS